MLGLFARSPKTSNTSVEKSDPEPVAVSAEEASPAASAARDAASPLAATSNAVGNSVAEHQNVDPEPSARKSRKRISLRAMISGDKRDLARTAAARSRSLGPVSERRNLKNASKSVAPPLLRSRSQERARQSALVVRSLIVGPTSNARTSHGKGVPHTKLNKVKAELVQNKSANKVISQLRNLPSSGEFNNGSVTIGKQSSRAEGPIHAVCLALSDEEIDKKHFSQLVNAIPDTSRPTVGAPVNRTRSLDVEALSKTRIASVATASVGQVSTLLAQVDVVSLITTPGMGLGLPGDGPGLLSGAIPTAQTVIDGIEKITPELMALGYATGQAVLPDHSCK